MFRNKPAMQAAHKLLTNASPLTGKNNPFSKTAITFEPTMPF